MRINLIKTTTNFKLNKRAIKYNKYKAIENPDN